MMRLARRVPVTIGYFGILLLLGIGTAVRIAPVLRLKSFTSTGFEEVVLDGRWWTPLTSILFTPAPLELLVVLPLVAVALGLAEVRMGSARTLLVGVGAAAIGVALGIGVQELGVLGGEMWSRNVREFQVADPFLVVVAVLLAASAWVGSIWRNRIRVVVLTTCVIFLLYSGQPSDLYRLLAAVAGLILGSALRRGPAPREWNRSAHHERRVLAATVVAITAIGPVITLFSGRRYGLLAPLGLLMSGASPSGNPLASECDPLSVTRQCLRDVSLHRLDSAGPVLLSVLPLLTLLVAALGLARGRRLAAWLTVVANAALAVLGIYYFGFLPLSGTHRVLAPANIHYWEITLSLSASVLVPLVISALVLRNLRHFTVRARVGAVTSYLRVVLVTLAGLCATYLLGGWLLRDQFTTPVTFPTLLADLPERFVPVNFLSHELLEFAPASPLTALLYNWIGPVFWAVVLVGALSTYFDRGALNYSQGVPLVRDLLRRGGGGYLGQWATWKGNSYWFSDDGRASVAYRVLAGVAITTTEPIGDPQAALAAIGGFARYCDDRGWIPVFYAMHGEFVPAVKAMGWRTMIVGEEAVLRPAEWTVAGKRRQDIRSSINRADRLRVTATWTSYADMSAQWRDELDAISNQWVANKALPEMGFTLGSIEELRSPDIGILLATDADNRILGVTSWMPSYRDGAIVGWTLDFMRRTPDGMNGVMEFLIAKAAERFRDQGAEFLSLSTAPLATTLASPGEPVDLTGRILAKVGSSMEPVYGFRSLFDFKRKFDPELHPIYLAYPDALGLPAIGLALAKAYLPMLSLREGMRFVSYAGRHSALFRASKKAWGRRSRPSAPEESVATADSVATKDRPEFSRN
jgi:phosphatidylglycerol lysyltransferase